MIVEEGVSSATAVEPNRDMLSVGKVDSSDSNIKWVKGSAEQIPIVDESFDLLTMASSFHWADFDKATQEFHRLLRSGGRFAALWNPRLIETNPILVEIEDFLNELKPNIERVSSGRSGITRDLTERLWNSNLFDDVVYVEGRHTIEMSKERYLSAWRSVNDLQVQLGAEKFEIFLSFVTKKIETLSCVEATYLTRAWSAKKIL